MLPRLVVVTPWFPTDAHPFYGAFVRAAALAVRDQVAHLEVWHVESVGPEQPAEVTHYERDGIAVTHVAVPLVATTSRADVARAHRDAMLAAGLPEAVEGAVVHAHVGMPTGWATAAALPATTPLVVTEHASYLNQLLRHPEARGMYQATLARASSTLAVSEVLRSGLAAAFPGAADRIATLGNPVDFTALPPREEPVRQLTRWLYVGSLSTAKGCDRLLEAFAVARRLRPGITLTMLGEGALRPELEARAVELGLQDAVSLPGAVPPTEIGGWLARHDVLVHLSRYETFGLTSVEAVASGVPLVVTRCRGPETVLADLVGGMVQLVDVEDDPKPVVAAWHRLGARLDRLDPQAARRALEQRLSAPVVGRELVRRYEAAALGEPGPRRRPHVVAVAGGRRRDVAVVDALAAAVEADGSATLVTADPSVWAPLPPAVEVVPLGLSPAAAALAAPRGLAMALLPPGLLGRAARGIRRRSRRAPAELAPLMRRSAGLLERAEASGQRRPRQPSSVRLLGATALARQRLSAATGIADADEVITTSREDARLARLLRRP